MYNLQKILSKKDIRKGFKKLQRKNRYRHQQNLNGVFLRLHTKRGVGDYNSLGKFIASVKENEDAEIDVLYNNLERYEFLAYTALAISKGTTGKFRPLLVPEPKDRLIFDALLPKYREVLDDELEKRSLLGLGLQGYNQKISKILHSIFDKYVSNGYEHVLILDYKAFFSEINRGILYSKMESCLSKDLFKVLKIILENDITNVKKVEEKTGVVLSGRGVPQGLAFAPFLACYYALDIDDIYISHQGVEGFRYIDDVILLAKDERELKKVYKKIEKKSKELDMKLHRLGTVGKTELRDLSREVVTFLGVDISTEKLSIPDSTFNSFLDVIKKEILSKKNITKEEPESIKKIYQEYVAGWLGHYREIYSDDNSLYKKLDGLIFSYLRKDRKIRLKFFHENREWLVIKGNRDFSNKGNK